MASDVQHSVNSGQFRPSTSSLVKSKLRRDYTSGSGDEGTSEVRNTQMSLSPPSLQLANLSDTTLKDMLLSPRTSLQSELLSCFHQYKVEVQEMGKGVSQVEKKNCKFSNFFIMMLATHDAHSEDLSWIKSKLADLEDRCRSTNIKKQGLQSLFYPHCYSFAHFCRSNDRSDTLYS